MKTPQYSTPQQVAESGHEIYSRLYQAEYEANRLGQFVIIDVTTERAYPSEDFHDALREARADNPTGIFHLMKVGAPGAYRVSYSANASRRGILQGRDAALPA